MNTNPPPATLEVVTMPSGNGWRVRIADGQRLQFVSGFAAKSAAEEWVRSSSRAWLAKLPTIVERL
jgi:hypothetical protein